MTPDEQKEMKAWAKVGEAMDKKSTSKLSESLMAEFEDKLKLIKWTKQNPNPFGYGTIDEESLISWFSTAITRAEEEAYKKGQEKGITIQLENSAIKELGLEKVVGEAIRRKIEKEAREQTEQEMQEIVKGEIWSHHKIGDEMIKKYNLSSELVEEINGLCLLSHNNGLYDILTKERVRKGKV